MSDIELAVRNSKELESLLETRLGAVGRGLHEKLTSVEKILSPELAKKLRMIATIRNKVVHEAGFKIDNQARFIQDCLDATNGLTKLPVRSLAPGGQVRPRRTLTSILLSLQRPAMLVLGTAGFLFGFISTGLGAGMLGLIVGVGLGAVMFTEEAIAFYGRTLAQIAFVFVLLIVVLAIGQYWSAGRPLKDAGVEVKPPPAKAGVSASTPRQR